MSKDQQIVIDVHGASFFYGETPVVDNVSFTVKAGEYLGIIGPNGGGKTTLVKMLLGLLAPTSGSVTVFGEPAQELSDRFRIGYVPQRVAHGDVQFPATVREIVASGRTPRGSVWQRFRVQAGERAAVNAALEHADVSRLQHRRLARLSGGERQRVFIARALAGEPKILILDEPTVGVDVAAQEKFYAFLRELNEKHGITILFITHDIDVIAREATSVLCLNHGLVCHGSPKDFIKEEYMQRLYGKTMQFVLHDHEPPGDARAPSPR